MRTLYSRAQLTRLLAPKSIAIIGASDKPGAFSSRTLENLANYTGDLYLVNPRRNSIGNRPCFSSIKALDVVPDCVVIAVPQEHVLESVRDAAHCGVGGAIIYASGFAETKLQDRIALQAAIAQVARESGMRVLGPNCLGVVNNLIAAGATFQMGYSAMDRTPSRVGLVSQSGALGYAILQGTQQGRGYTHMLAAGNACDVDVLDLANYLVDEPQCKALACVLEGAGDAQRLNELGARALAARKPIIVFKTATGAAGAEAAMSHTGSLASSNEAFDSAMRRGNFVQVHSLEELTEIADYFAKAPSPNGAGVAVMATSGGAAVMTADAGATYNVPLPQPGPVAQQILDANIPDFGSARNPCDITGQVLNNPESFVSCAKAMLDDPTYGVLVLPQVTAGKEMAEQRCEVVSRLAAESGKPVCIIWLSDWLEGPGASIYARDRRVSFFRSTERCFKAISLWQSWHAGLVNTSSIEDKPFSKELTEEVLKIIQSQPKVITERVAKKIVALHGIPVVKETRVDSKDAAVLAAQSLGFPVVLKLDSPDATHKTELGAVKVGLQDASSVAQACEEMLERARGLRDIAFLVQPMMHGNVELMLGMKRDAVFGPMIVVGLGGILVELLRDIATDLAPISKQGALNMLERLGAYPLLKGYRGKPGVNLNMLSQVISDFSQMCVALDSEIEEVDLNPLICSQDKVTAVDALIIRRNAGV